jgi:hypothetical protein
MSDELIVYVADAGSVSKENFHWVSSRNITESSLDPRRLAEAVAQDLSSGTRVALGYESPLFVPVNPDPNSLGCARDGECQEATGNRPFTAGAGAAVLATGIQSLAWVLREIKRLAPNVIASTRWDDFFAGTCQLFVWEAFVSGSEKAYPPSHAGDAALAIAAFRQVSSNKDNPTRIRCSEVFSLAGAAIVWAGLSENRELLKEPCVVLRPLFSAEEAQGRLAGYKLRQAEAAKAKAAKKRGGAK